MGKMRRIRLVLVALLAAVGIVSAPASAQQKPNILFIMGDDIGWMQPGIYHRGLMVRETPNIDRIGQLLWLKELESYVAFPPMQDPASYKLSQVLEQIKKEGHRHPSE